MPTFQDIDELAQWVWDGRDDPTNPCENYARRGEWVAAEFDGGGTCEVIDFGTPEIARVFIHKVRSSNEDQRLQAWGMTGHYCAWSHDCGQDDFPLTFDTNS